MKILYFSPHPLLNFSAPTGYGTHMREMVEAFRSQGCQVELLIMGGTEVPVPGPVSTTGTSWKRWLKRVIPAYCWRSLKERKLISFDTYAERELREKIQRWKPDLIYERSAWMSEAGRKVSAEMGITHFVEVNAPFEEEVLQFEGSGSWYEKEGIRRFGHTVRQAARVLPVSSSLKNYLVQSHQVKKENIVVVPNAVNGDAVHVDEKNVLQLRKRYSLTTGKTIGFVGSIFPYHGVDELIRGAAALMKRDSEVKLLIVGDGMIIPELKELSKTLGVEAQVIFTGQVPRKEVFDHISAMDITVLARTNWYCSPVKLFEYGFLNKPVIAPETAAVRDVMDETCGWFVRAGTEDLSRVLNEVMSDRSAAGEKGITFGNRIRKHHTWIVNARNVMEEWKVLKQQE